jgi:hypothetical protein
MGQTSVALLSSVGLFLGILLAFRIGWYIGTRSLLKSKCDRTYSGLLNGVIFVLLGLLIAFTFSGATSQFDHRRDLMMEEANAIRTAYHRLDLLPVKAQPALRTLFRQYLDARLDIFQKLPDQEASEAASVRANMLQRQIWSTAVNACQASGSVSTTTSLLAALNEMFNIANLRTTISRMRPPIVIFVMLLGLALISSALAGYEMADIRDRNWIHVGALAVIIVGMVYLVLDIEYSHLGLIRINTVDQMLLDLRKSMG